MAKKKKKYFRDRINKEEQEAFNKIQSERRTTQNSTFAEIAKMQNNDFAEKVKRKEPQNSTFAGVDERATIEKEPSFFSKGKKVNEVKKIILKNEKYEIDSKLTIRYNFLKDIWNIDITEKNGSVYYIITDRGKIRGFKNLNTAFKVGKDIGFITMLLI